MKLYSPMSKLVVLLAFFAGSLFSLESRAQVLSFVTSANICDLRNIGNGKAREGMIRENGQIQNILDDLNIPVYCPISTQYGASFHEVVIVAANLNSFTQEFSCILTEYDLGNFKIRSVSKASDISAGFVDALFFEDFELSSPTNRLDLRCEMPPKGSYGVLGVDNFL